MGAIQKAYNDYKQRKIKKGAENAISDITKTDSIMMPHPKYKVPNDIEIRQGMGRFWKDKMKNQNANRNYMDALNMDDQLKTNINTDAYSTASKLLTEEIGKAVTSSSDGYKAYQKTIAEFNKNISKNNCPIPIPTSIIKDLCSVFSNILAGESIEDATKIDDERLLQRIEAYKQPGSTHVPTPEEIQILKDKVSNVYHNLSELPLDEIPGASPLTMTNNLIKLLALSKAHKYIMNPPSQEQMQNSSRGYDCSAGNVANPEDCDNETSAEVNENQSFGDAIMGYSVLDGMMEGSGEAKGNNDYLAQSIRSANHLVYGGGTHNPLHYENMVNTLSAEQLDEIRTDDILMFNMLENLNSKTDIVAKSGTYYEDNILSPYVRMERPKTVNEALLKTPLAQQMLPDFEQKLISGNLMIPKRKDKLRYKQSLFLLIDRSGSMLDVYKQGWVKALLLNRMAAVKEGTAELFIATFEGSIDKVFKIETTEQCLDFFNRYKCENGGGTDIEGVLKTVSTMIKNNDIQGHKLTGDLEPEIIIINDGQDHISPDAKIPAKVHAFILGQDNENLKKVVKAHKGHYERML
jgi:hypothetical protein